MFSSPELLFPTVFLAGGLRGRYSLGVTRLFQARNAD
jgi:hypothetical protein